MKTSTPLGESVFPMCVVEKVIYQQASQSIVVLREGQLAWPAMLRKKLTDWHLVFGL